jgi:hypothetical protein
MAILADEQVKQLFRRVLGRSISTAARSIMAHCPTLPEPSWAHNFHEFLPVQYLLVALKELIVVAPHHSGVRQAVKEAGELVKVETFNYIKDMFSRDADADPTTEIMAMDCFLALGLHVPTFYPVAKGFLLDFQSDQQGAILLLKGLDGEIFHAPFSLPMFRDVLDYFRHNKISGLASYEYFSASFGFTDKDVEWKKLLRERLDGHGEAHENARAFWTHMCYSKIVHKSGR